MRHECECENPTSNIIEKAIRFAIEKHGNQLDDSGEWFFWAHCRNVGQILYAAGCDEEIVAAGYLHDTIEDTDTTYEDLLQEFGKRIADIVNEVTHEGNRRQGYFFPRLKSRDAIIVKYADRISNLRRMDVWPEERQRQYLARSVFWKSKRSK